MAKAGLPEPQSPGDVSRHPPERRLTPAPSSCIGKEWWSVQPSGYGTIPSEGI
jgi:hypothetical protein